MKTKRVTLTLEELDNIVDSLLMTLSDLEKSGHTPLYNAIVSLLDKMRRKRDKLLNERIEGAN